MPYTVAVLADVHGNWDALEAVLEDVGRHSPDQIVFAGDLLMNGPKPAETIARLRALGFPGVVGNTDLYILAPPERIDPVAAWTRERLDDGDLAYLSALPIQLRVTPPAGAGLKQDLLIVHATPRNADEVLILEVHPYGTSFTETTPPDLAAQMLQGVEPNLVVYGHIHYFSTGVVNGQRVMSVGSVGCPFDHDPRAAYGLAVWDGLEWTVEAVRVEYDYQKAASDLEHSGVPYATVLARRIREADWVPRG